MVKTSAFKKGFSKEACLSAYAKVRAALLSMKAPSLPSSIQDEAMTVIAAPSLATSIQETAVTITVIPAPSQETLIQETAIFHAKNASFNSLRPVDAYMRPLIF